MAGGDPGLQGVGAEGPAELLGARERGEAPADEEAVPAPAVLIEEEDRLAGRTDPRPRPRGLDLHQRDQAVDLRLGGHQPGEDAPEAQRLVAQRRPHPVVAAVAE